MSKNDYIEFKDYLEHGLFKKKKKQYYKEDYYNTKETPIINNLLYTGETPTNSPHEWRHGSASVKDHHSNVVTKVWFDKKFLESEDAYNKRTKKRHQDWKQAQNEQIKSYNSQLHAKKDIERAEKRLPSINNVKNAAASLESAYNIWNNAKKDLAKAGSNGAGSTILKKKVEDARNAIVDSSDNLYTALRDVVSNYNGVFNDDEIKTAKEIQKGYNKSTHVIGEYYAKEASKLFHSSLEHGWLTDLFKKKTNTSGSRAGMPSNIPTSGMSERARAEAIRDAKANEVNRLAKALTEYEQKMSAAKQEYDYYKKMHWQAKNDLKAAERARDDAAKKVLSSPEPRQTMPVRSMAPANVKLQRTSKGSTAGMPSQYRKDNSMNDYINIRKKYISHASTAGMPSTARKYAEKRAGVYGSKIYSKTRQSGMQGMPTNVYGKAEGNSWAGNSLSVLKSIISQTEEHSRQAKAAINSAIAAMRMANADKARLEKALNSYNAEARFANKQGANTKYKTISMKFTEPLRGSFDVFNQLFSNITLGDTATDPGDQHFVDNR